MPSQPTSRQRERTSALQERTFRFAKRVLDLCPRRYDDDPSRTIWRQLIRAASAASGILEEADEASSTAEFIYKMKVVLRETKEARRWLRFIVYCHLQNYEKVGNLPDEARQLASIFATIVTNTERRVAEDRANGELTRAKARAT